MPGPGPARGRFITLEGGEGAGKSTQVAALVAWLRDRGFEVVATREPGGAPGAEAIRALLVEGAVDRWQPMTEALLHAAARHEHLAHTVRPALARGAWVVSDRYVESSLAYQGVGQGVGVATVGQIHTLANAGEVADLTVLLDLPARTGLARAAGRGDADRYERFDGAFHDRINTAFRDLAAAAPQRFRVVDAGQPAAAVTAAVIDAVARRFGLDHD
ncbi:dTMP kinase [Rhodothalassium salexigens]|uniref:dTMP kinase n=1 Tax=Rhodothalassium salexigens TaxID=1086 RepID=UPI001046CDE7|nr:dTMP kinase [Rhodothalassium salexigens]MBK1638560.1 dTMP kinase [Rhodothalassium salexigens DSM 2132]